MLWPYIQSVIDMGSRVSSVSIATRYVLDSTGIESSWGARFSALVQTVPGAHPASVTGCFPRVNRPVRGVDHPTLLEPSLKKE